MNDSEAGTSGSLVMDDFDVFLNHRGPDVKATFVAHLEESLRRAGFRPFLDARSLMKSNPAFESIDQALEMAKVHVAVVSQRYAESKYCLNELVAMMKSGKPVIPVFYNVEPADLRWLENGPFAEAFEKHKLRGRTLRKLQEWRDALQELAKLTGFRLADYKSDEAKLKREVVNEVARLTPSNDPVDVEQYRVGLESPTSSCIQMLEDMGTETGILGLVGMGGVGKTTLAREIYNHFVAEKKFRNMTFLEIHRDNPSSSNVQVRSTWSRKLRRKLLWDLLSVQGSCGIFPNYGSWFRKVSTLGPVFIVIDDVHKLGQFEELIPSTSLLHPGSRILITSRDRSIFNNVAGRTNANHHVMNVSTLSSDESNVLFNWHAFHAKKAPEDFEDLAKDVVKACDGLPLALKVIGSSLFDKRSDEDRETLWPEAVDTLRLSTNVMGVLKWSFDNLPDSEKLMFLDITCVFYDRSADEALAYWRSCGGVKTPHTCLRNLSDKNMINRGHGGPLRAHDLLRDLGQEIGRKAKSHLVCMEDGGMIQNQGTEQTLGLNLRGSRKRTFEARTFANMPNLHSLALPDGCIVTGDLGCMSRELRLLKWRGMPFRCVPAELNLFHLLSLDFSESTNLASLWTESNGSLECCPNLLQLNLENCTSITKLPDSIGQLSRLQRLQLSGCTELKRLPKSIGQLKALESLDLSDCLSLKALPDTVSALSNLRTLIANYCTSPVRIPTSIELPSTLWDARHVQGNANTECQTFSGEAWTRLEWLALSSCSGLGSLFDHGALKSLSVLSLHDSTRTELPECFGRLIRLEYLDIDCKRLQCLPKSIGDLRMLKDLMLHDCDSLRRLPKTLGALISLESLGMMRCHSIRRLPKSVGLLSALRRLTMIDCKSLQKLPTSMRQLRSLEIFKLDDCGSIEAMGALTTLQGLPIWGSTSITKLPAPLGDVSALVVDNGDNKYKGDDEYFVGITLVLEEDESGFLEARQLRGSGEISLLRRPRKLSIPSFR